VIARTGDNDYHLRMTAKILAVARSARHTIAKPPCDAIRLLAGLGVDGDAHAGRTIMHRYDRERRPEAPNLRQVHLLHAELLDELADKGFTVGPGQIGENITTRGIDLLGLSCGTRLRLGDAAVIEITGLRNPCVQIDQATAPGVMAATLDKRDDGSILRKSGVMAIVIASGEVRAGDRIDLLSFPQQFEPLVPV
jgi:MOSC domain